MDGTTRRIVVDWYDKHGARVHPKGRYEVRVVECDACGALVRYSDTSTEQREIFDRHDRWHALVDRAEPIIGRPTLAEAQAWARQFPEVPRERSALSTPTGLDRFRLWLSRFAIR